MNKQRHSPREEAKRPERLLRLPAVAARLGMSRGWIYDEIAAGRFPRPVKVGVRASAWLESEIDGFLAARARERTTTVDV